MLTDRLAIAVLSGVFATSVAACANERDAEPSSGADACEHLSDGPERGVSAGVGAALAADVSEEHTRYDLTLPGDAAPHVGFVKVAIGDAGEHVFFFDGPVEVAVTDADGAAVAPEGTAASDPDCAKVRSALTFELGVGTYTLAVTSEAAEVSLVWFPTTAEHEHR